MHPNVDPGGEAPVGDGGHTIEIFWKYLQRDVDKCSDRGDGGILVLLQDVKQGEALF